MTLEVHHAHLSKTTANLRVLLSQKDTVKLSADITYVSKLTLWRTVSNLTASRIIDTASPRGLSIDKVFRLSPPPAPVDLVKLEQNIDRNWIRYHIPYNKNSGAIPETHWYRHFDRNGPSDPRVHDCWWCFADPDSRICNSIIPYLADIHLRMVYNFEETSDFSYAAMVRRAERSVNGSVRQEDLEEVVMTLWPATQSIHLEIVRQLPPAGIKWVFQRAEAKAMNEGKLVVEVTILDEKMELIAIGQTVDLIIPARSRVKDGTSSGKGAKIWKI